MERLREEIRQGLAERGRLLIALDGRCGCGKSSLAAALAEEFDGNVFHMDDFYLPFAARETGWTDIPAGNMDLRRFRAEVLEPLRKGQTVWYRAYLCSEDRYQQPREIPFKPLSIVEGSYCEYPILRGYYDRRIFVTAAPELQEKRLRAREGAHFAAFRERWIPMEENYFSAFRIEERADRILRTDSILS